jgi:16S rRNA (guanine966-N2)-methyltransferase
MRYNIWPRRQAKFDLIFLDPPYNKGWIARLEPLLPGVLNEDAAIYVEAEHAVESLGDWRTVRQGKAGKSIFTCCGGSGTSA